MGRPEKSLDPTAGSVQQFAAELREVRELAGRPTYRQLAAQTHYSSTVLSRAAAGKDLPSLAVTLAFVEACGGDCEAWTGRWQAARDACAAAGTADAASPDAGEPGCEEIAFPPVPPADPCFADSYSLTYEYGYKDASFKYSDMGWTFETWLDYSPLCKSNFTYTQVIVTGPLPYYVSNKVRRGPGPDGPYVMEHAGWLWPGIVGQPFASALVYSPHNTAQSCLSTNTSDQIQCTTGGPNGNGYY